MDVTRITFSNQEVCCTPLQVYWRQDAPLLLDENLNGASYFEMLHK